jgi:cyclohexanecarboxylate-CoA ligase
MPERIQAMGARRLWGNRTLLDCLDLAVASRPDAIAIVEHRASGNPRNAISYRELDNRSKAVARLLRSHGIASGDVVSCLLPNWWDFAALHLACLRLGAITNALIPILRERELRYMMNFAETKLLVIPSVFRGFDYSAMIEALRPDLPSLRSVLVAGFEDAEYFESCVASQGPDLAGGEACSPNDVIEILYTSGTTGEPKGVMHSSNTLFAALTPYAERLNLGSDDVVLMASPLAHQTGFIYGMMLPIYLGCPVVLMDVWNAERAAEIIAAEGVTFTMGATPFLSDLTEVAVTRPEKFGTLRTFMAAGAPIPPALVRRAKDYLGAHIVSGWGMTENGAVTTTLLDDPPEKIFETDGCPLPGREIRVVGPDGDPLPAGQEGYLQTRSCSNFVGYLKKPELNATDPDGWFDTGDMARVDGDGYLRITGRTKDIIIRGGENIPVIEIENLLHKHPDISEVAIVAMPDDRLGERACAFVIPKRGADLSLECLVRFLNDHQIATQYLPERLEVMEDFPRTASGKVQKAVLRDAAAGLRIDRDVATNMREAT